VRTTGSWIASQLASRFGDLRGLQSFVPSLCASGIDARDGLSAMGDVHWSSPAGGEGLRGVLSAACGREAPYRLPGGPRPALGSLHSAPAARPRAS
jgi:hypothetical protein